MISLGVDIGGTGVKCVAFREDGRQLALRYAEYPNPTGNVNLHPGTFASAVMRVIRECAAALEEPRRVAAITVSSFGESFVPIDAHGDPLTDIIMYFANSESGEFDALVERFGAHRLMEITRTLPDASYSLSKMLYTKRVAPRPVWKYLPIAGYICYLLSGAAVTDISLACRTMLFDVAELRWSEPLLYAAGLDLSQMPQVYPSGSAVGSLLPGIARNLQLPESVRVVVGAHDQIVNALASGVAEPGEAVDVSGTCECITPLFREIPQAPSFTRENFACIPYVEGRGYVTYAYNISGGAVVRWYRDQLARHLGARAQREGVSIYDLLNRECPQEPTGLIMLPFLQGMGGTPNVDPDARGLIYGLSMDTGLPDIYRAILEGLTLEMAFNLGALKEFGIVPKRLYACGGGARSRQWLQIKADVWNREVVPVLTEETGALGSAILGFAAVMGEKKLCALAQKFTRHGEPFLPDARRADIYARKFERYRKLRAMLTAS